jgi:transcriptional regulator with XRE-family HTH domain
MVALESFSQRIQRLRVARGLSERELAARMGLTVRQYQSVAGVGAMPTCTLLIDLTEALNASVSELTESIIESPPTRDQIRAFLQQLRESRAPIERRVAAFRRAFGYLWFRDINLGSTALLEASAERNDTLRAWTRRYVKLVVERCDGNRTEAGRVLGIHHHTLRAYLDGKRVSPRTEEKRPQPRESSDEVADPAQNIYTEEDGEPIKP